MIRQRVLTVFWHSVDSDCPCPGHRYSCNPTASTFRNQIQFLLREYTPISISTLLEMIDGQISVHDSDKPPILLGFDDGFRNVLTHALPVLIEFQVPATFFVIGEPLRHPGFVPWFLELAHLVRRARHNIVRCDTENIDLADPWGRSRFTRRFETTFRGCRSESERHELLNELAGMVGVPRPRATELDEDLQLVTPEDLAKLDATSFLTVGSHAMTHRHLASLPYQEQVRELEESDAILRKHCPLTYRSVIAYPGGSFNKDTTAIARQIYRAGFAVFLGSSHRNMHAYPRIGIDDQNVQELSYLLSGRRRHYLLPIKRFLHNVGIRRVE